MQIVSAVVADFEAPELVQPGERPFDRPPDEAKFPFRRPALRDLRRDAQPAKQPPERWATYPLSATTRCGLCRGRPRRPRTCGKDAMSGTAWFTSWTLAAVTDLTYGVP